MRQVHAGSVAGRTDGVRELERSQVILMMKMNSNVVTLWRFTYCVIAIHFYWKIIGNYDRPTNGQTGLKGSFTCKKYRGLQNVANIMY